MSEPASKPSSPRTLAGLMKLTGNEPAAWLPGELGAILQHQLAAPLEYDLRTIAPGGEQTISNMTAAIKAGTRPRTFGDLIRHPAPPIELLDLMKNFARGGRDDGTIPAEVGTVLYYAAIALALIRHNNRITKLDDQTLRKGIEWTVTLPWLDQDLKQIFADALAKLG